MVGHLGHRTTVKLQGQQGYEARCGARLLDPGASAPEQAARFRHMVTCGAGAYRSPCRRPQLAIPACPLCPCLHSVGLGLGFGVQGSGFEAG